MIRDLYNGNERSSLRGRLERLNRFLGEVHPELREFPHYMLSLYAILRVLRHQPLGSRAVAIRSSIHRLRRLTSPTDTIAINLCSRNGSSSDVIHASSGRLVYRGYLPIEALGKGEPTEVVTNFLNQVRKVFG